VTPTRLRGSRLSRANDYSNRPNCSGAVVVRTAERICKDLVRLGDLTETPSGIRVAWVDIRMGAMSKAPVGVNDLFAGSFGPHVEPSVEAVGRPVET
jgi:hypothetical protein